MSLAHHINHCLFLEGAVVNIWFEGEFLSIKL